MVKKLIPFISLLLNSSAFVLLALLTTYTLWQLLGKSYVWSEPVGSDYFNALTYLAHFAKHQTNLASSWLPFWNEGNPAIGGYPFLGFLLMIPLLKEYSMTVALNLFSYASLVLFFIASLLLIWQVSKNWLIAASFVLVLMTTRATYYQLTTGAFISSANIQWFLPAVLFFLYRFCEKNRLPYLVSASILSGLALLAHGATSFLMVLLPSTIVFLFLLLSKKTAHKLLFFLFFAIISVSIGSIGLYTLFLQTFIGSGTAACASSQCWGEYPKHLIVWLTPISAITAVTFFLLATALKVFARKINLLIAIPAIAGLLFFFLYVLSAYLKLIDGVANVIFPTRIFWAANLFMLLAAASFFAAVRRVASIHSSLIASLTFLVILFISIVKPVQIHKDFNATVPFDAVSYTIPQFATKPLTDLVPEWLIKADTNWRLDIFNSGLVHWWNFTSQVPQTRGYSNHPLGVHQDWLFFLQSSTRDVDPDIEKELVANRTKFLLDAFGIKYIENSQALYPSEITNDKNIVLRSESLRDFEWFELKDEITTPIVSATNSPPVLFIGDPKGYESFIRVLAMINTNSKVLIPVRGSASLGKVTEEELENFPIVFLYQYSGDDFAKLTKFVQNGGHLYIETGSQQRFGKKTLPQLFPAENLEIKDVKDKTWQLAETVEGIDTSKFSELSFKDGPWRTTFAKNLRSWAQPVLLFDNKPIITKGQLGKGVVVWSGFNFPFHVVDSNNFEEAKLFKNLLNDLVNSNSRKTPEFKVSRPKPELIEIETAGKTKGLYFKENYHSGWQAKVNETKLPVYKAGLEFMYVPVKSEGEITLEFKGNQTTWGLFWLTIVSLATSIIYLFLAKPVNYLSSIVFARLRKILLIKLNKKIKGWIEEE